MNSMTIVMVVHNEAKYAKLSIRNVRRFADIEWLAMVMVDNHSEDWVAE